MFPSTTLILALAASAFALPIARRSEADTYRVVSDSCISHGDRGSYGEGGHFTVDGLTYDNFLYYLEDCLAQGGPEGMTQGPSHGFTGQCGGGDSPESPSSTSNGGASPSSSSPQGSSSSPNGGSSDGAPQSSNGANGDASNGAPSQSNGDGSNNNNGSQGQGSQGEGAADSQNGGNGDRRVQEDSCVDGACLSYGLNLDSLVGEDSMNTVDDALDLSPLTTETFNILSGQKSGDRPLVSVDDANTDRHGNNSECTDAVCLGADTDYENKNVEDEFVGADLKHVDANTDYDVVEESKKYDYTVTY